MWFSASGLLTIVLAGIVIGSRPTTPPKVLHYTQLTNDGLKKSASLTAALATDDSSVYFGEQDPQQGLIAQVSVTGGSVSSVARFQDPGVSAQDYSPQRAELLINFGIQSPLWGSVFQGGRRGG
jgi:hypothetical protein